MCDGDGVGDQGFYVYYSFCGVVRVIEIGYVVGYIGVKVCVDVV